MIHLAFRFIFCHTVTFLLRGSHSFELLEEEYGKVILVNAIFRHGERSPIHSYPTDPHKSYKWPDGEGQLLQVGKQRVFEEGEWFKRRYRGLLATVTSHTNISVLSSGIDRTIMTGQCFLAGFFTPKSDQALTKHLKWHAIPIHSDPLKKHNILVMFEDCAMYKDSLKKFYKSKSAKNIFDKYDKEGLFKILRDHSGFKFSRKNISDCYVKIDAVHDVLSVQSANNFKMPSWTKQIFPEPVSSARASFFVGVLDKLRLKKITAGPVLKSIRENMVKKQKNQSSQSFHFYSAHDLTLMIVMNALKIYDNVWPPYGSSLVFELRERKNDKYVTIFYKNSTTSDPIYLDLPQCEKKRICPLKTFLSVTKHLIPKDMDLECKVPKK